MATQEPNKQQLLNYLAITRQGVLNAVEGLSEAQMTTPMNAEGWTIKDALAHLAVWDWAKQEMVRNWRQRVVSAGVALLADVDAANDRILADWRGQPLAVVLAELHDRHAELIAAVEGLTEAELAQPVGALWPDSASLLEAIEGTGEHNAEHAEELAAWRERLGVGGPATEAAAPERPGKTDLLAYLQAARQQVLDALAGLTREQLEQAGVTAEGWSPRDLLATLAAWDREAAAAIGQIARGEHPLIPDMTLDDLARFDSRAVERGRTLSLEALRGELYAARSLLLAAVEPLDDARLYQPPQAAGDTTSTVAGFLQVRAAQDSQRAGELAFWRATRT